MSWRARLGLSSTVLSLLVALITVATAAVPVFKTLITPQNSDLVLTYQGTTDNLLLFLVSNNGIRPGSVNADFAYVESKIVPDKSVLSMEISQPQDPANRVIEPGKSVLFAFTTSLIFFSAEAKSAWVVDSTFAPILTGSMTDYNKPKCVNEAYLKTTSFVGEENNHKLLLACDDVEKVVRRSRVSTIASP